MHTTLSTNDFIIQMKEFRLETFMFVIKLIQTKHNSSVYKIYRKLNTIC